MCQEIHTKRMYRIIKAQRPVRSETELQGPASDIREQSSLLSGPIYEILLLKTPSIQQIYKYIAIIFYLCKEMELSMERNSARVYNLITNQ